MKTFDAQPAVLRNLAANGRGFSLTRSKEFTVTLSSPRPVWIQTPLPDQEMLRLKHFTETIHTELTSLDCIIRTRQPLPKRLPKHSVDRVGNMKRGIFGEVKANCTEQTWEVGLLHAH